MNSATNALFNRVKLGALVGADVFQNGIYKPASEYGQGTPIVRITNFDNLGITSLDELMRVSLKEQERNVFALQNGDILINRVNSLSHVGKSCLITNLSGVVVFESNLMRLRLSESSTLNPRFLALVLQLPETRRFLRAVAKPAIAQASINQGDILAVKVPRASSKVQSEIVDISDLMHAAVEAASTLLTTLERRKQGLMQQLLTGRRRLKGFKGKWKLLRADKLFTEISVRNQTAEEQLLSVTQDRGVIPRDMLAGRVTMPAGTVDAFKLVERDNFVISLRSFQGGLEHSAYRGLVSPAYTVLQASDEIHPAFYRHYFKSTDFVKRLSVAVVGIRDGKQISYTDFRSIKLPLPPMAEQQALTELLDLADQDIALCRERLNGLQRQKRALMQKLLSGEWRLPDAPAQGKPISKKGLQPSNNGRKKLSK